MFDDIASFKHGRGVQRISVKKSNNNLTELIEDA